jgi:hypothetical protein
LQPNPCNWHQLLQLLPFGANWYRLGPIFCNFTVLHANWYYRLNCFIKREFRQILEMPALMNAASHCY